ncbi:MAG: flagellar assembly protein FliW [Mariprofundaceae bacterium]|nr:flagellar assembly protein FliW [Mariprofundaceae bacterium]
MMAQKIVNIDSNSTPEVSASNQAKSSNKALLEFQFPRGVAGFADAFRFAFIYEGMGNMVCMQSVDCPEASFILTPWDEARLGLPPTLSAEQRLCLDVEHDDEVVWLLVLNPFADATWVTANLRAPIAICENTHMGLQCIRNQTSLDIRFQWMRQPAP